MTWLGKILTVLVLLMALVWVSLTSLVFATRTNWKNHADAYKKAYGEAVAAREKQFNEFQAEKADLMRRLTAEQDKTKAMTDAATKQTTAYGDNTVAYRKLAEQYDKVDATATQSQTTADALQRELKLVRDRNDVLEDERQDLIRSRAKTVDDLLAAKNDAELARSLMAQAVRRYDTLKADFDNLRAGYGAPAGSATGPGTPAGTSPVAVLPSTRGEVEAVSPNGELVVISLGIDAGIQPGAVLELSRTKGGAMYVGTATVQNDGLSQKRSVALFKPAGVKPLNQLKPDEKPQVGDVVRPAR